MVVIFWLSIVLAFYWLMYETHWLTVRFEDIRFRKFHADVQAVIDLVPVIVAASIVVVILKWLADMPSISKKKKLKVRQEKKFVSRVIEGVCNFVGERVK